MSRKFQIDSIKNKIFIYVLVFIICPIILIAYISNNIAVQSILEQKRIEDSETIKIVKSNMYSLFESVENYGKIISKDESIQTFLKDTAKERDSDKKIKIMQDFSKVMNEYTKIITNVVSIEIMDKTGYFISKPVLNQDRLYWYFNNAFFKTLNTKDTTWTKVFSVQEIATGEVNTVISAVVPIEDTYTKELLGYVILHLPTYKLDDILSQVSCDMYLLDENSYIIANKSTNKYQKNNFSARFYINKDISYSHFIQDTSAIIDAGNKKFTVTTQKDERFNTQFVIVTPFNEINKEIIKNIYGIFVVAIWCVIFAFISAFLISSVVTKPLFRLKKTMNKVNEGDLDLRYISRSRDEIGQLGSTFNSMLDTIQNLMQQTYEQQKSRRDLQLQLIHSQLRPHFLYNVLEMISSFVRDGMKNEALTSIKNLSNFYRGSLSDGSDTIFIDKESFLTENYLNLQRLRYIEFMDFTISFDPSILKYKIPKLTLQPVVENSIYHGLKCQTVKGKLCVTGYLKNDRVYFEVFDNGVGMSAEKINSIYESIKNDRMENNFGIVSVMKRLNIYFNNQADIEIVSEINKFTNFTISFPAIE